jgi:SPP1 gp7 family putative phage head morphogenesis protein
MDFFREVIFQPLFDELDPGERANSSDALNAAIIAGTVVYGDDGIFRGSFNAAISYALRQLGALKTPTGFALSVMPADLRAVIAQAKEKRESLHQRIIGLLLLIAGGAAVASTGIQFSKTVDKMVVDLQKQFAQSVSNVPGLAVKPGLAPDDLAEKLRAQVKEGADFAIKNFTEEITSSIRAKVAKNLLEGGSPDKLAQILEAEYGVAKRKASVIADCETSIATAAFRQARYESLGSTHYVWRTMGDSKVRPTHGESNNHRALDGRTFPWASPPIVDSATGRRRHPGQDYGPCRCVALPILPLT